MSCPSRSRLAQRACNLPPPVATCSAACCHSSRETVRPSTFVAPAITFASLDSEFWAARWNHRCRAISLSANQARSGAIPVSEIRWDEKPEHQHQPQVYKHRDKRGRMRQTLGGGVAEDHRLHTTK